MAIPGYPAEDLLFKPSFIQDNIKAMHKVVAASAGIAVVVGYVDADSDIYNASAVAYDGHLSQPHAIRQRACEPVPTSRRGIAYDLQTVVVQQGSIDEFRAAQMIQDRAQSVGNAVPFPRTATPYWIIWVAPSGRVVKRLTARLVPRL